MKKTICLKFVNITLAVVMVFMAIPMHGRDVFAEEAPFQTEPMIAAGLDHTVVLKSDGTVWTFGYNWDGQLGDGTTTSFKSAPVQVKELTGVTAIAAGYSHTVALKSDGTVWTFGRNDSGQLGDGTTTSKRTLVQVKELTGVTAIAAGYNHTVALKNDGTVWTFGNNLYGGLGDGTTTNKSTPVQVKELTGVTAIAAGQSYTVSLKSDGTIWTFGGNAVGQLGDGTTISKSTPVQVKELTGVTAIAARGSHTVLLKSDGTVWTFGNNLYGGLGDGTTTDKSTPMQVKELAGVTGIAAGGSHTVLLKSDGTVWTFGWNDAGQLGDGTTTSKSSPVQVKELAGITAIAAGGAYTVSLKSDGTVWTFGYNMSGQLGDGMTTNKSTPVQVLGENGVGYLNLGESSSSGNDTDSIINDNTSFILNKDIAGKSGVRIDVPAYWNDNFFANNSSDYNHDLAKISMQLSASAYSKSSITTGEGFITTDLEKFGFNKNKIQANNYKKDNKDTVGFTLAVKPINCNSTSYNLLVIAIRGTPGNVEWDGNFDMGSRTTVHRGFQTATTDLLSKLNTYVRNNIDRDIPTKVLVFGHSRGAAVANLAAKTLTEGYKIDNSIFATKDNIYAYTFATPSVSLDAKNTESVYSNIFNFVHYDDFVPIIPLKKWDYGKYGITLRFPRAEEGFFEYVFEKITNIKFQGYNNVKSVESFEKNLGDISPTIHAYYTDYKEVYPWWSNDPINGTSFELTAPVTYFERLAKVLKGTYTFNDISDLVKNGVTGTDVFDRKHGYEKITNFFIWSSGKVPKLSPLMPFSHAPETYISWMRSLPDNWIHEYAAEQVKPSFVKKITVACPVNVEIYDEDGQLVGSVIDNVIDESVENPVEIELMGEDGDIKEILLPSNKHFNIVLTGTDSGKMDYTVSLMDIETGEVVEAIEYTDIALALDKQFLSGVSKTIVAEGNEETPYNDVTLYTQSRGNMVLSVAQDGVETETNKALIKAIALGNGSTSGTSVYEKGAAIMLEAKPDEGYIFEGWYEDGLKISDDFILPFTADESRVIEAHFGSIAVNDMNLDVKNIILYKNSEEDESIQLNATIKPENATNKNVLWESSDESIAVVTSDGNVTAMSSGTAIITATTLDGEFSDTCTVTIEETGVYTYTVTVNSGIATKTIVAPGESVAITANNAPVGKVFDKWITKDGVVFANANSATTSFIMPAKAVTVTATYKGESPMLHPLVSISLNKTSFNLKKGGKATLTVSYNPTNTTDNKAISWSTSNVNVATVFSGIVTARGTGTAIITAKVGKRTVSCTVKVTKPIVKVKSVKLNKTSVKLNLKKKKTVRLTAKVKPENATNKKVTWKSSNNKIATVKNGKVTAKRKGIVTITATTKDGKKKKKCKITIK